jgi:hypothetical protein
MIPDGTLVLTDWKTGRDDDEFETEIWMKVSLCRSSESYEKTSMEVKKE